MSYEMEYTFEYVDLNDQEHEVTGTVVLYPETEPSYNMTHDVLVGWSVDDFTCDDELMKDVWLQYIKDNLEDDVVTQWEQHQANELEAYYC